MKLLIVDDEPLALSRLQRLLQELGEQDITQASHAYEALEKLEQSTYDALITDIHMPDMNGLDLAYAIRSRQPKLPIVFQSAYEEHALRSFDIGVADYLLKPYDSTKLARALARIKEQMTLSKEPLRLLSKNHGEYYLLEPKDIYYLKADLTEVLIRSRVGFSYYGGKISQMEPLLEVYGFFKIHRSYLINLEHISKIETTEQSRLRFFFDDIHESIDSSKDGAKAFRTAFPKSIEEQ